MEESNSLDSNSAIFNRHNYFKLRDIADIIDFGVEWDEETNTISIDTNSEM